MTHEDFKKNRLGKKIDTDGTYGNQCVDLSKFYAKEVHGKVFGKTGNAQDWFTNGVGTELGYKKVLYAPGKIAPRGAIIFWKYGIYGHTAIVDSATDGQVSFIEQNGVGDNPATAKDEAGDGIGVNAIRLRTSGYNNISGRLVDPLTVGLVQGALSGNSGLWKATYSDNIKDILNKANNEIRKSYV